MVAFSHFQLTQNFGEEPANDNNLIISIVNDMKFLQEIWVVSEENTFFYISTNQKLFCHMVVIL